MNTIAIQLHHDRVDLLFRDAHSLRIVRRPPVSSSIEAISQAWPDWLVLLSPRSPYQMYCHDATGPSAGNADALSAAIEALARQGGATSARVLRFDDPARPALHAARRAADRHRLGCTCCIELERDHLSITWLDRRGTSLAREDFHGEADDTVRTSAVVDSSPPGYPPIR